MTKHVLAIALLFMVFGANAAIAEQTTVTLKVSGMTCASCPYMVKRSLTNIDGVEKADVSLAAARAVVTFDTSKTTLVVLTAATAAAGFPSTMIAGNVAEAKSSTAITAAKPRGSN